MKTEKQAKPKRTFAELKRSFIMDECIGCRKLQRVYIMEQRDERKYCPVCGRKYK